MTFYKSLICCNQYQYIYYSFLSVYIEKKLKKDFFNFHQIMPTYYHLTLSETITMTFLVVVSIFAGVPTLIKVFKKGKNNFIATIVMMSMLSSLFYHLCEIYDFVPFLQRGQWQRMDNVFTITSIQLMLLFMWGTLHQKSHFLEYSALINTIIIQQKDPWNFNYTIYPILFYLFLGIILRVYQKEKLEVKYVKRNMILALVFLTIGALFYVDGLDDGNDYLRFSHGMWHLSIGVFGWYVFEGVQVTMRHKPQDTVFISPKEEEEVLKTEM